jgi:glycosyltransferase involved in cell wall biosynthesis
MGGLFVTISNLARASLAQGVRIDVVAPCTDESLEDLLAWRPVEARPFPTIGPKVFRYSPKLLSALYELSPDLIDSHGIWAYPSLAAYLWSKRVDKPYVISIHGMLEPWALQQSRIKKRLARWLYQDRVINGAACLRATSRMELENIRLAGFNKPVAVVPPGIDVPPKPAVNPRSGSRSFRTALFLSRLHPKKGLLNLIEAWREVRPQNWNLLIVGPDDNGYRARAEAAVAAANLENSISFSGPSWGEQRFDYYWTADLFVLPSFSENFGMVIAEALACELPVITTRALPWHELEEYDCGWWVNVGTKPLIDALREAFSLSDQQRTEMGVRGRNLVAQNYAASGATNQMIEVYGWLLGRTGRPSCIVAAI